MNAMFDGFRKAARHGNDAVIVFAFGADDTSRSSPYIFKRAPLRADVYACTLHDDEGGIVAVCRMDEFDL
ncbi:hypothetical protein BOC55_35450 [Burkholderia pseudomallei]|nr:hypothetical protein BOC54_37110 [Burkholderia pseudomallei]ARL84227.1 hypothetical protein BOC55_35450 [Burkholderia pseudomallei]